MYFTKSSIQTRKVGTQSNGIYQIVYYTVTVTQRYSVPQRQLWQVSVFDVAACCWWMQPKGHKFILGFVQWDSISVGVAAFWEAPHRRSVEVEVVGVGCAKMVVAISAGWALSLRCGHGH
jgi:hypothetical protein